MGISKSVVQGSQFPCDNVRDKTLASNSQSHEKHRHTKNLYRGARIYTKVKQSRYRPEVPRWSQEVKVPRLRDNGTGWWQGCQPNAPAAFTHRKYSWYSFLLETESTPGP